MAAVFNDIVAKYNIGISTLAQQLRGFLLEQLPAINEEIDLPANMASYNYGFGYKNAICVIIPSKKGLKLGFNRGSALPDPEKLLTGTGKVHRYVVINTAADFNKPAVKQLLVEALLAHQQRVAK